MMTPGRVDSGVVIVGDCDTSVTPRQSIERLSETEIEDLDCAVGS